MSTMLDYVDYNIAFNHYQGNGNGYDQLNGDWAIYYKVAKGFTHRVKSEDRQDFLHDLLLVMAKVKAKYEAIGKPLTEAGLIRVACYEVASYWRKQFRITNGLDCGSCSQRQRNECKEQDLYRECPKAIKVESLDRLIEDGDGNQIELHQMIADDKAVDIVAMLDAKHTLNSYPRRAVQIAYKRYAGYPLNSNELNYLSRFKKRAKQRLFA
jgi:hypothetical protein